MDTSRINHQASTHVLQMPLELDLEARLMADSIRSCSDPGTLKDIAVGLVHALAGQKAATRWVMSMHQVEVGQVVVQVGMEQG